MTFDRLTYYYFLGRKYGAKPSAAWEWAIAFNKWWDIPGRGFSPRLRGVDYEL